MIEKEQIELIDIKDEAKDNFTNYSEEFNHRSMPNACTGLKEVALRSLWGAYQGKMFSSKPFKKCARLVGDVMGKYHPHGDSSIYEAIVRLSRPWVMRYPLFDWHGNQGSISGDDPAAMRYTETRLMKLTEEGLFSNIEKDTIDFKPNFDETEKEPITLPAVFPNLLCNPNLGIGCGLANTWGPHNLNEVAEAIHQYLNGEEPMIPGPDFPTGGLVINKDIFPSIMKTGSGTIKVRGRYKVDGNKIIFYEVPYGTTLEGILDQIAKVTNPETDKNGKEQPPLVKGVKKASIVSAKLSDISIQVVCEKGVSPDVIAKQLYSYTSLQTNFSYNMQALVDDIPTLLNLKDCIKIYVDHNINCIKREAQFDKDKALARLEVVEGLLIALADIDNVIAIIKKSESPAAAKEALIKKYGFTDNQVTSILNMKLSSLARLEGVKLENEKEDLKKKIERLEYLITDYPTQIKELTSRLDAIVKKYGDARRTELAQIEEPKEEKEIALVEPEDVVIICTQSGDIKRIPKTSFKTQKRNGKGVKTQSDAILSSISTNTIDTLLIFTSEGRMFRLLVDNVPEGTNASKGVNLASMLKLNPNEKIMYVTSQFRETDAKYVVFFTKNGLIKKTKLEEFKATKKTTGIQAIKFKDGDSLANVTLLNEEEVIVITKKGMSIRFSTKDIAPIGRVAAGVKAIKLKEGDEVITGLPISKDNDVAIFTTSGLGKRVKQNEFISQGRGGVGIIVSETPVAGACLIDDSDYIFIIGIPNSICIRGKDISIMGRTAAGVQIINGSKINKVVKL